MNKYQILNIKNQKYILKFKNIFKILNRNTCKKWVVPFCILVFGCCILFAFAQEETQFVYELSSRRDPMIPLVTTSGLIRDTQSLESKDDFYLEGIIYDKKGKSFAIIDGQIVNVGDIIREIKILDIQEDKVIILKDNHTQEMGLEEEEE